jgi:hypothetical protein
MLRKALQRLTAFNKSSQLRTADMELLSATQEALHFSRLPREWRCEAKLAAQFSNLLGRDFPSERVFLQRTRLGAYTGQGVARIRATESPGLSTLKSALPEEATVRPLDAVETRNFFDQSRRLVRFTDDLRELVNKPVVTISGVPETYGPNDVQNVLKEKLGNKVNVCNVVLPFDRRGVQQQMAFVSTKTESDANKIIDGIGEEFPVPLRRVYGVNFGCALLTARRETLFVDSSKFPEHFGGRYWTLSMGWRRETSQAEFLKEMHKLRIFPEETVRLDLGDGSFLMKFPRMEDVKKSFTKLHRLAYTKKIPRKVVSYAYPVMADFRCLGDASHEGFYDDSDLDEPVEY